MNFSWVEDGLLAGCRGPRTIRSEVFGLSRHSAPGQTGVRGRNGYFKIGSRTEQNSDCYEPMDDFTAPPQEQNRSDCDSYERRY